MNLLEENKFIRQRNPKKKILEKPLMSNGSEFLKDFDQYLDNSSIPHYFTLYRIHRELTVLLNVLTAQSKRNSLTSLTPWLTILSAYL